MQRNKVGPAMAELPPPPSSTSCTDEKHDSPGRSQQQCQQQQLRGDWRTMNGVQSGMSLEDLKHQTALRLANEQQREGAGQVAANMATSANPNTFHFESHAKTTPLSATQLARQACTYMMGSQPLLPCHFASYLHAEIPNYDAENYVNSQLDGGSSTNSSVTAHAEQVNINDNSNHHASSAKASTIPSSSYSDHATDQKLLSNQLSASQSSLSAATDSRNGNANISSQALSLRTSQDPSPRMPRHDMVLQDRRSTENRSLDGSSDPKSYIDNDIVYGGHNRLGGACSWDTRTASAKKKNGGNADSAAILPSSPLLPIQNQKGVNHRGGGASTSVMNQKKNVKGKQQQQRELKSLEGRVTPVKDIYSEGQRNQLFSTPNNRREISTSTPTSVYSEPHSRNRKLSHPTKRSQQYRLIASNITSPKHAMTSIYGMQVSRSPDLKYKSCGGIYGATHGSASASCAKQMLSSMVQPHQSSKLPHGLTVQELKEMTRARLAAEAEAGGPDGLVGAEKEYSDYNIQPDISSVHSSGTHTSSKGSRTSPVDYTMGAHFVGHTNANVLVNQGMNASNYAQGYHHPHQHHQRKLQEQPMQYQHARQFSPAYGSSHTQFNSNQPSPDHTSPVFRSKPQLDTFDSSSVTSASEYHAPDALYTGSSTYGGILPNSTFNSFSCNANAMKFNRERCFSAGTGIPVPSFLDTGPLSEEFPMHHHQHQLTAGAHENTNRRRSITMSPPGMSRLHEDHPFLYSPEQRNKLVIPPLSEPRPRFHSTGLLGSAGHIHREGCGGAFLAQHEKGTFNKSSLVDGRVFQPIGYGENGKSSNYSPPPPPSPLSMSDRLKFNFGDQALSLSNNVSMHGDLPSSMAEAVLESLTASIGPNFSDFTEHSPFRSSVQDTILETSHYNKSMDASSLEFPFERVVTDSSGSGSMFSASRCGSKTLNSSENLNDKPLSVANSWGGEGGEDGIQYTSSFGFHHDFGTILSSISTGESSNNMSCNSGPGVRGRAATAPCFGENGHTFVSQLDPEHHHHLDNYDLDEIIRPASSLPSNSKALTGLSGSSSTVSKPPGFEGDATISYEGEYWRGA